MIYRGTTPRHYFEFPFESNEVAALYISYMQKGQIRVEKELSEVTFDPANGLIQVDLTQEDTLAFEKYGWLDKQRDSLILIQIRVRLENGECWVTDMIKDRLGDVLKDGVI